MRGSALLRAVGYRRVSTGDQSLGLEAQQTAIVDRAHQLGIGLAETFTDEGLSGGLPLEQRPGLLAALHALKRGDILLVAKRDRLGRDVLNVAMIERLPERKGARIVSAAGEGTDSSEPASVLMRQIIDVFAQYERAVIRSRTKAALRVKKAAGQRTGSVPFAYALDVDGKTLRPCAAEQAILMAIRRLREQRLSLRRIAEALNAAGHRTRFGTSWKLQRVAQLLAACGGFQGDGRCLEGMRGTDYETVMQVVN